MTINLAQFCSRFFLLVCFLNYLLIFVSNKSFAEDAEPKNLEDLKAAIEKIRVESGVPAIGVALADEHGPIFIEAFGEANKETHYKAETNTLFRVGSISKMFVALSVLKLVEEGKLHLNDKVHDLAPEIEFDNPWEKTNPILVVHLLEHTTGWDDERFVEYAHNESTPVDLKTALSFHPQSRQCRWIPGTRFAYNNIGPAVTAYIIEKVSGKKFEDYVQEHFFNALDMQSATYFNSNEYKKLGATLYHNDQPVNYWNQLYRPSGAINASPKDMANFLTFMIQRGEFHQQRILSNASIDRMEKSEASLSGLAGITNTYGLHNQADGYKGVAFYGHSGFVPGSISLLNYLPQKKSGFVLMMNSDNGGAAYQIESLLRDYLLNYQTVSYESSKPLPEKFNQISGWYQLINSRNELFVFRDNLLSIQRVWSTDKTFFHAPIFAPWASGNYTVNENLLADYWSGLPSVAVMQDPLVGEVLQMGQDTYKRIPSYEFIIIISLLALWALLMLSHFLFPIIWIPRLFLKKILMGPSIAIRTWPVIASVLFIYSQWLGATVTDFDQWAKPTITSVSVTFCTIAYAIVSSWCLWLSVRNFKTAMNRWAYWHSTLLSLLHVLVVIYLLNYGIIGVRTWAY